MAHYGKLASAVADVASSTTDQVLVTGVTNRKIRVYAAAALSGSSATNFQFNTKPAGSGTIISMTFQNGANGGFVLPYSEAGWFETNSGDSLSVTTGSGSQTGVMVLYAIELVPGSTS